jgi:Rps23 Pro-64 3,4-dihydroxylase Tpa1-like proline 4-hydroxylase
MEYVYNNNPVGMHPKLFSRNEQYTNNLDKLGSNNLKIIKNFLLEETCIDLIKEVNLIVKQPNLSFWDQIMYSNKNIAHQINNIIPKIKTIIKNEFNIDVSEKKDPRVAKWGPGTFLKTHVDDLSYDTSKNHISTVIYLNNDYVGGEIFFPEQDIIISPSVGDLIIFPGNLNYPHEVKEILSGNRYTIPTWFRYI